MVKVKKGSQKDILLFSRFLVVFVLVRSSHADPSSSKQLGVPAYILAERKYEELCCEGHW